MHAWLRANVLWVISQRMYQLSNSNTNLVEDQMGCRLWHSYCCDSANSPFAVQLRSASQQGRNIMLMLCGSLQVPRAGPSPYCIPDWMIKHKDEIIQRLNQLHTLEHKDKPRELKDYVVYLHTDIVKQLDQHNTLEHKDKPSKLKDYVVHVHNDIIQHHTLEINGRNKTCKLKDYMVEYVDDRVRLLAACMQTVLDTAMHISSCQAYGMLLWCGSVLSTGTLLRELATFKVSVQHRACPSV